MEVSGEEEPAEPEPLVVEIDPARNGDNSNELLLRKAALLQEEAERQLGEANRQFDHQDLMDYMSRMEQLR